MNIKLKLCAVNIVFLCFSAFCAAQSNDSIIKKSVTVERDFVPEIQSAGKIETTPSVVQPQKTVIDAVYSDFSSPLSLGGNIHPLSAATLLYAHRAGDRPGFARLAVGFYPNSIADFSYPLIDRSDMRLDAVIKQRGVYNEQYYMTTTAQLAFDKYFDNLTLFGGLNFGYQGLKYYGENYNENAEELYFSRLIINDPTVTYYAANFPYNSVLIKDLDEASKFAHFFRAGANLGVRSAENAENWRYLARLKYGLFRNTAGVTEHFVNTSGQLSFIFNENRIGVDAELYNAFYNSKMEINFPQKYGVLVLSPYFEFNQLEKFDIRFGVLSAIQFAGEKGLKFAPDVRLEWKPIPKTLKIYAGFTGKYKVNSMDELFYENPYLASDVRVRDTYTPMEFYGGLLIKPTAGLLFDVFADYSITNNDYFFVNKSYCYKQGNVALQPQDSMIFSNRFDVVYDHSNLLILGGRVSYTLKDKFNFDFSGKYFTGPLKIQEFPWQRPQYEFTLNTSYRVVKDVNLSLTGYYQTGLKARLGSFAAPMKNRLDLNFSASYTYSEWLTVFLAGNNLLNQKYDIYFGYKVQGINAMIGAVVSF
ncbi:MAG: hypothetical protein FWF72_07325 [Paludibacter sp.]|nr:hypothetical protein [Paludibacter sp.]